MIRYSVAACADQTCNSFLHTWGCVHVWLLDYSNPAVLCVKQGTMCELNSHTVLCPGEEAGLVCKFVGENKGINNVLGRNRNLRETTAHVIGRGKKEVQLLELAVFSHLNTLHQHVTPFDLLCSKNKQGDENPFCLKWIKCKRY